MLNMTGPKRIIIYKEKKSLLESENRTDQHQELSKYVDSDIQICHKQNNEKL